MTTEFQKGARAMFDYLLNRAANNFHANPKIQDTCTLENNIIEVWTTDALKEIDPESYKQWKSIEAAYEAGRQSVLKGRK